MIGNTDKEVEAYVFLCCEWVEHLSFWATFKVCECQHVCLYYSWQYWLWIDFSWMDAALQKIRVSGQCGTIPRSFAFQKEAFCEIHRATALREINQHLKETEWLEAQL